MCSWLRGVSMWFTPLACGPGSPELSKSYMDMASKLLTFTFTFTSRVCAMCGVLLPHATLLCRCTCSRCKLLWRSFFLPRL